VEERLHVACFEEHYSREEEAGPFDNDVGRAEDADGEAVALGRGGPEEHGSLAAGAAGEEVADEAVLDKSREVGDGFGSVASEEGEEEDGGDEEGVGDGAVFDAGQNDVDVREEGEQEHQGQVEILMEQLRCAFGAEVAER
jgi:hypothetical protein